MTQLPGLGPVQKSDTGWEYRGTNAAKLFSGMLSSDRDSTYALQACFASDAIQRRLCIVVITPEMYNLAFEMP